MSKQNVSRRNGGNIIRDASVVGNLKLEDTPKVYKVTTNDVESFLQDRLNCFVTVARNKENELAEQEGREPHEIEDVQINLKSVQVSNTYVPFLLFLPENALAGRGNNRKEKVMSIFEENDGDGGEVLRFKPYVYEVIKPFMYTKADKEAIKSTVFKSQQHVSVKHANNVASLISPKSRRVGNRTFAVVILDGIRLFSYMVRNVNKDDVDRNGNPLYYTDISDIKKINDCEFNYKVTKTMRNKDKKRGGLDFNKTIKDIVMSI